MKQTGDLNLVKKINKTIVLDHIRFQSPISRAKIAELTGLTKATVSTLVGELIESELANETGTGTSSGGRKPVMLEFNAQAGYAVGVDLGVNYILAVLTDLTGAIIEEYRIEHFNDSESAVTQLLKSSIAEMIRRAPACPYGVVGIGIGVPGVCDENGNVVFAPNLGWHQVPLQQTIEQAFGIPVVIDNEANAGAVGEKEFGAGKDAANLVYVSIGIGIGAGIIIKHELYRGVSGFSGEVGHVSIAHDGKPCLCGNIGCWELYASENALIDQARRLLPDQAVSFGKLVRLAEEGNPTAVHLFEELGKYLGVGIVNLINSFNPERIVIGGRLASAEKWLRAPLLNVLSLRSLPYPRAKLDVMFSELGARSVVLGACSFAIRTFFASAKVSFE